MGSTLSEISPMSVSQAAYDNSRHGLLKVAAAGLLTGVLTPLFQPLIDKIAGSPGDLRIALLALPFAILIFILVRRNAANPWWAAFAAAILTMLAFDNALDLDLLSVLYPVWQAGVAAGLAMALQRSNIT